MRVWIAAALAASLACGGCASVQKKFTRKAKEPKHRAAAMYVEEGAYQKKFSNDYYYRTHYTLWRSWHEGLLDSLGQNRKKVERSAQESAGHLRSMAQYLVPDKRAKLETLASDMTKLTAKLDSPDQEALRPDIERLGRLVANEYYYEKMKDSVLPDNVDLGVTP